MNPPPPPGPPGWPTAPPTSPPLAPIAAPPSTAPVAPAPVPPRGSHSWPIWFGITAVVLVAALAGGVLALVTRDDDEETVAVDEAALVLAEARAFLAVQETVRFDTTLSIEIDAQESFAFGGGIGRYEAEFPDRIHTITDNGARTLEEIQVGPNRYSRTGPSGASLDDVKFDVVDTRDSPAVAANPIAVDRMLDGARAPRIVDVDAESTTISVIDDAPTTPFFEGEAFARVEKTLILEVGASGEIRRVVAIAGGGPAEFTYETDMINWNVDVEINEPRADELDPTPTIDEELIADFDAAPVLSPARIPEGWEISVGTILEPENTVEKCRQGHLEFENPQTGDTMDFFSLPADCESVRPPDARDVVIPNGPGWIGEVDGETWAEFVINGTRFQVRSTLTPEQVLQVIQELVIFDPANPPPDDLVLGTTS